MARELRSVLLLFWTGGGDVFVQTEHGRQVDGMSTTIMELADQANNVSGVFLLRYTRYESGIDEEKTAEKGVSCQAKWH